MGCRTSRRVPRSCGFSMRPASSARRRGFPPSEFDGGRWGPRPVRRPMTQFLLPRGPSQVRATTLRRRWRTVSRLRHARRRRRQGWTSSPTSWCAAAIRRAAERSRMRRRSGDDVERRFRGAAGARRAGRDLRRCSRRCSTKVGRAVAHGARRGARRSRTEPGAVVRAVNALDAIVTDYEPAAAILAVPPFIAAQHRSRAPRARQTRSRASRDHALARHRGDGLATGRRASIPRRRSTSSPTSARR